MMFDFEKTLIDELGLPPGTTTEDLMEGNWKYEINREGTIVEQAEFDNGNFFNLIDYDTLYRIYDGKVRPFKITEIREVENGYNIYTGALKTFLPYCWEGPNEAQVKSMESK